MNQLRLNLEFLFKGLVLGGFILGYGLLLFLGKPDYIELILPGSFAAIAAFLYLFEKRKLAIAIIFLVPLSISSTMGGFGFATSVPAEPLAGLLALYVVYRIIRKPSLYKEFVLHPLTLILLVDLIWLFVVSGFSSDPIVSLKRIVVRMIFLLIFYVVMGDWFKDRKNIPKLYVLYGLGLIYPIYYIMRYHAHHNFIPQVSFSMTHPFYDDHTVYGACIAFILPGLLILFYNSKEFGLRKPQRYLLGGLLTLLTVACALSYSRAAWLSLGVALLFYGMIRLRISVIGLVTLVVIGGGFLFGFQDTFIEQANQNEAISNKGDATSHLQSVTNVKSDASNLERINRWICAIGMFKDRPITGWGPGTYQFNYGQYQTTSTMTYISTRHGDRGNAHSEYLTYLSEAGLPGFLSFLFLILITIATGLKAVYNARDSINRKLALGALLGLVTWFFHGLFNSFIDQDKMAVLVFGSMAMLVAIEINNNEASKKDPKIS